VFGVLRSVATFSLLYMAQHVTPSPLSADVLDWRPYRGGLLLGIVRPPNNKGLVHSVSSATRELAEVARTDATCTHLVAVVLCSPATADESHFLQRALGFGDLIGASSLVAGGRVFIEGFKSRMEVFTSKAIPLISSSSHVHVALIRPRVSRITESAAWMWLFRGVAVGMEPRFVITTQAGSEFAPHGLRRLCDAAESLPPEVGALVGAHAPLARTLTMSTPYAAYEAAAMAGSLSADGFCAAVALPPCRRQFSFAGAPWGSCRQEVA